MKVTLYDFYQTHCNPCKMVSPIVDQLAEEFIDSAAIFKINIDEEHEVDYKEKYGLMSTPTFILEVDGEVVERQSGFYPYEVLKELITKHL